MKDVKNVAFVFELPVFVPVIALSEERHYEKKKKDV